MMNFNIKKSFKDKKFKYGGYAVLLSVVLIAILVLINLVVGKMDIKLDMTKNKLFSLSDQTYKVLDNLKEPVNIYGFYESGKEDPITSSIINKYAARTKKINVEYKDPIKYPQIAQKFSKAGTNVAEGSIVVEKGSKFKVIDPNSLVNYTAQTDSSQQPQVQSLAVEQQITSALLFVTSDKSLVLDKLQGHGEQELSPEITKQLNDENYNIKDLNLLTKDSAIEDGATLLVMTPASDITKDEADKVKDFLSKGGRAIFMMGIVPNNEIPNFNDILATYGVALNKSIVIEGDNRYSTRIAGYILPIMGNSEILAPIKASQVPVLIPMAQSIDLLKLKKASITIDSLLTTSENSWAKKNLQANTAEKENGDLTGPFNVAVAITDKASDSSKKDTKIVLIANSLFTDSKAIASSPGNVDFAMNSFNWLQDKKDSISIRPKDVQNETLNMTAMQQFSISAIVVVLIPGIILVSGIMVWLRRRHQ